MGVIEKIEQFIVETDWKKVGKTISKNIVDFSKAMQQAKIDQMNRIIKENEMKNKENKKDEK